MNPDFIHTALYVVTPVSLLAFLASVGYGLYARKLKHSETVLRRVSPDALPTLLDTQLTRYGISGANLTRDQKSHLILQELDRRYRSYRFLASLLAVVFLLCFAVAAYAYIVSTDKKIPPTETSVIVWPRHDKANLTHLEVEKLSALCSEHLSAEQKRLLFDRFRYVDQEQDYKPFWVHVTQAGDLVAALSQVMAYIAPNLPDPGQASLVGDTDTLTADPPSAGDVLDLSDGHTPTITVTAVFRSTAERYRVKLPADLRCDLAAQRIIANVLLRDVPAKARQPLISPGANFFLVVGENRFSEKTIAEAGLVDGGEISVATQIPYPWIHDAMTAEQIMSSYIKATEKDDSLLIEMMLRAKVKDRLAAFGVGVEGPAYWDYWGYLVFANRDYLAKRLKAEPKILDTVLPEGPGVSGYNRAKVHKH